MSDSLIEQVRKCADMQKKWGTTSCFILDANTNARFNVDFPALLAELKRLYRVEAADAERKRVAALEEENKRLKAELLAECVKAVRYGELVGWMASEEANSCTVYDPACGEYVTPLMAYGQERARRAFKESSDGK